uniref:(northern house mosquito) hypothetical protein n=1 Tax=Culex pipiens TaxID=7175 RepID=A0A8D8F7K4_CULPI
MQSSLFSIWSINNFMLFFLSISQKAVNRKDKKNTKKKSLTNRNVRISHQLKRQTAKTIFQSKLNSNYQQKHEEQNKNSMTRLCRRVLKCAEDQSSRKLAGTKTIGRTEWRKQK